MVRLRHAAVAVLLIVVSAGVTLLSIEAVFRLLKIEPYRRVERQRLTYRKNSKGFRDYEYDLEKTIERLLALAQPAILIIMGIVVAVIILSVMIPLSDVSSFTI